MKKARLSRKRCSLLPDIYTLFDKTSAEVEKSKETSQNPGVVENFNDGCHNVAGVVV
jgi:hypothetical protein